MAFKTDFKRAAGLGSAHEGARHWWMQRLTAIALLPLAIAFVYIFGTSLGSSLEDVTRRFSNPINALVSILFFAAGFYHLKLGLQVVIEDYVHGKAGVVLQILNALLCFAFAAAGVFAVLRISLGAGA